MTTIAFTDLVDQLYVLSYEEQLEAKSLLESYLSEKRRDGFVESYEESLRLEKEGKLTFSSDISELMKKLND